MTDVELHELRERLHACRLLHVTCDRDGRVTCAADGRHALERHLLDAPVFVDALATAAPTWGGDPAPCELLPGVWAIPVPLRQRRRLDGHSVVVVPTRRVLEPEALARLVERPGGCGADLTAALTVLPPVDDRELDRLAALVRLVHEDHARGRAGERSAESLGHQLAASYEEMNLLYTILQSMTVGERPDRFVSIVCTELLATLPYGWIAIRLADDPERPEGLAGPFTFVGTASADVKSIRDLADALDDLEEAERPLVLEPAAHAAHAVFAPFGASSLVHPIANDGARSGLLIAGDKQGEDLTASSVDMKLLGAAATLTAIFLENAALYEDLNAMFLGTLEALTASIDAKDRYTCGHSQRVAHLTQRLARAIGLDEEMAARMRIAGLVHDVGKIGVPERVLLKPGTLNEEEFAWIRRHPGIGHRILKDIPRLLDILPGVLHHHERWDGNGYPDGIAGTDIPLVARVIALADSFDAMSSDRTYRARMTRAEVRSDARCRVHADRLRRVRPARRRAPDARGLRRSVVGGPGRVTRARRLRSPHGTHSS
jgi:HD-GYP domain-containing protein (c-di-GMP phosphodiesterase class II)